jgi:hypothetical protein
MCAGEGAKGCSGCAPDRVLAVDGSTLIYINMHWSGGAVNLDSG